MNHSAIDYRLAGVGKLVEIHIPQASIDILQSLALRIASEFSVAVSTCSEEKPGSYVGFEWKRWLDVDKVDSLLNEIVASHKGATVEFKNI